MLTSRAEHRVLLRHDNADLRLSPLGHELGLLPDDAYEAFRLRRETLAGALDAARSNGCAEVLRRPEAGYGDVAERLPLPPDLGERLAIELKLEGYVRRQEVAVARAARSEGTLLPANFPYASIGALSREARDKLALHRPASLGAAARIAGISPADVAILSVHLHRFRAQPPAEPVAAG
jgi:tRNA uridine 5-carboxymethylaminomethyl modification enzyme